MKKLLSLLLAACCMVAMTTATMALDVIVEGEDSTSNCLVPGRTYSFKVMDGSDALTDDYFDYFSAKITVVDGKGYISQPTFKKQSNGTYRFVFTVSPSKSYKEDVDVSILIQGKDKKDKDNTHETTVDFTVGYGGSEYCSDNEITITADRPLVEFDENLRGETITIDFDGYASVEYKHGSTKMTNFAFNTDTNQAVLKSNNTADMTFIDFYTAPSLPTAKFKMYAPGARNLYRINSDNSLTRVSAGRDGDFLVYTTDKLGAFVASDIALRGATSESASSSVTETTSSSVVESNNNSSSTGGKVNPATGAVA